MENEGRRKFLKQTGVSAVGMSILPLLSQCEPANGNEETASSTFEKVPPELQGVSSQGILNFIEAANASGLEWHSFMLIRRGYLLAEAWWKPFEPSYKHTLYSLSKSFSSMAVGLTVEEKKLKLEEKVISFFPDDLPENVSEYLKEMDVRDLLSMTTGHETDSFGAMLQATDETSWVSIFLAHPVEHQPGSKFVYDTGATYMLSAIIQKVTGEPLDVYLKSRLFDRLGITNYDWEKSPQRINMGGTGLRVTTEAIARLGQMLLQKGKWNGQQIISESWINEATRKQNDSHLGDSEWSQGYGYQFWQCKEETVYRGDGAYGQFCIVMPKYDAVIVATSESKDMGKSMEIIFDHLLPIFSDKALEENPAKHQELQQVLSELTLALPQGIKHSEVDISNNIFEMEPNEFALTHIQFSFEQEQIRIDFNSAERKKTIIAGIEKWHINDIANPFPIFYRTDQASKIAATATWINKNTLQINVKFVEGIHGDQYTCTFSDNTVEIALLNSVADSSERNREKRDMLRGEVQS